jgi:hypothetical protein
MSKETTSMTLPHPRSHKTRTAIVAFATAALLAPQAAAAVSGPGTAGSSASAHASSTADKGVARDFPRTIITTDPELDDLNSMLRMLLYSNEIGIEGLIYSASQHHYSGDVAAGIAPKRWPEPSGVFHIDEAVNRYEEAYSNLIVHDKTYPTPDHLRSLIRWGNVTNVGDMSGDTPGSDLIKETLLDDRPGPVFLQAWGGPNTIAQALKSIHDEYRGTPAWDAIYAKVSEKAVITSWGQQDTTFRDYIRPNWPEIEHREVSTSIWGYGARSSALPEWQVYLSPEWTKAHVSDVGPIGDSYRVWGDGKQMAAGFDDEDYFGLSGYTADELRSMGYLVWTPPQPEGAWISEGDSSNFALLLDNGLRNFEDPSFGGWGGRQAINPADPFQWRNRGVTDIGPDGLPRSDYSAGRWFEDFQLDFAARLQWTVTPSFEDANHEPQVTVPTGIRRSAAPGEKVRLVGSVQDPDGDSLAVKWWQYREAGTYEGDVSVAAPSEPRTWLTVPKDAQVGSTIHLILEVQDDGTPSMTSYQRVVVTVAEPRK